MSFSSDVKAELARVLPARPCCRAAELCAIFRCEGSAGWDAQGEAAPGRMAAALGHAALARKTYLLLKASGCEAHLEIRGRNRRPQARAYRVEVLKGAEALRQSFDAVCGPLEAGGVPKARCCLRAYLRGAFLCRGSLASPEKEYHLEFAVEQRALAESIVKALGALGLEGKVSVRKGAHVVYLKGGEAIVEALKEMGASKAILEMENVRIVKGMRNRVNRLVNSETANVEKTVVAALSQLEAIRLIEERVGLEALPPALRSLARARLEHPYASLRELGELLVPQVSKSGVNYRMNRLLEYARNLMEEGRKERRPRARRNMISPS